MSELYLKYNAKISSKKILLIKTPTGIYLHEISAWSNNFKFNIITTKRNNTAIAPIYTIIKTIAKYSTFNKNNKPTTLQNNNIRNKIECTVFLEKITPTPQKRPKLKNK